MPLGTEVGLGSGHIVLDGDPIKAPPLFGPCLLWPNGRPSQLPMSTCSACSEKAALEIGLIVSDSYRPNRCYRSMCQHTDMS